MICFVYGINTMSSFSLQSLGWNHFFQQQLSFEQFESCLPFRVSQVHRSQLECLGFGTEGLQKLELPLHFWREQTPEQRPTVGDWLLIDRHSLIDKQVSQFLSQPIQRLERKSLIKRMRAGISSEIQLIAANIDTLLIVTSCNEEFSINRVERYLALAAEAEIHPIVVLTKADLTEQAEDFRQQLYRSYPHLVVEKVNATDPTQLDALRLWCGNGQSLALVGSSGVGKSTLTNSLIGQQNQLTQGIREDDSKGRHTTTSRSLHQLVDGGVLLDTPGMRELQLVDSEAGIRQTFSEIEQLAAQCRFQDCQHQGEPDCKVIEAVEQGKLDGRQLENYHKLMAEQARNSESLAEKRSKDRALGRFYQSAKKSSRLHKKGF